MFALHPRLREDTLPVSRLQLTQVLLMNDRSLPWLILVPERERVREIHELHEADRALLIEEIALASRVVQRLFSPDKINLGALGNLVPQLHIHIIGRFSTDRSWPGPVWGTGPIESYTPEEAETVCRNIRHALVQGG
ncbi:MAG: HIT family protein [Nitrospirota bacterium]